MTRRRRLDPYLLLLFVLALPALAPLWAPGYFFDAHDGRHSVFYLIQFDASLRDGALWPRWAMHHIQGYGYPTFLIQAPLGFYLGELFVLLGAGFTLAAKFTWAVGVLAGAWGMYALVRHWLAPQRDDADAAADGAADMPPLTVALAAVAGGVLYTYFPYHLVDIYVRGALNDSLLLGWLPWLVLVFDRLLLGAGRRRFGRGWNRRLAAAMLVLAGALLTHTFALLSLLPLLITFILFRLAWLWRRGGAPWRPTLLALAGGMGALGLCAIFLLPLLAEGRYLQQQVYVSNTYDFRNHFIYAGQYFSPFWGFGYSDDPHGANDGMSFQLGAVLAILGIAAAFALPAARRARAELIYLLAAGAAVLVLMTPVAQPLWEAFPPLAVIQFPWRLLALTGFLFSALGALTLANLIPAPGTTPQWGEESGLIAMALVGILASWPYLQANLAAVEPWREDGRAIFRFEQEHPDMIAYTQWVTQPFTTTAMTADYAAPDYIEDHGSAPTLTRLQIAAGQGQVTSRYSRGSSGGGSVTMAAPGVVQVNEFYFPGWQVQVDGQPAAIRPAPTGAILVDAPAGAHRIDARFGETPARTLGAAISAAALAAALLLLAWPGMRRGDSHFHES